jgi:sulfate/thiosulfate transport system permease protein
VEAAIEEGGTDLTHLIQLRAQTERRPSLPARSARLGLVLAALALVFLFLVLPLTSVFVQAFAQGWQVYIAAIRTNEIVTALKLTLRVAAIAVPLNVVFGLASSWAIARFDFIGKKLLVSLIDIPLAVSPVVAGLMYVQVFGLHGWFGGWLRDHNLHIIFAVPGIVLATIFVTFPFVARELIPFMQAQGSDEEQAAVVLGARPASIFWRVTLPNIKWPLLYGTILAAARSIGEFGAVSVVSGHIRGLTVTLPLAVEMLYNDFNFTAAFAAASLLSLAAVITLIVKKAIELSTEYHRSRAEQGSDE